MVQKTVETNRMTISRYPDKKALGRAAAADVASCILQLLERQETIRMLLASAPSQDDFLEALRGDDRIPWQRIICFHLDEYVGLGADAPQSFSRYLRDRLFHYREPAAFYAIDGLNDPDAECRRYAELLSRHPIDIACIGIGENGHIAFNEPHVANFRDPLLVRRVTLEETSRQQQVNDGCFAVLEEVPREAITLTVPAILAASHIFCMVPGVRKSKAVREALYGPLTERCPASVLRTAKACSIYLDQESASLL
jgi:glucosamine-6-phosphate deaminase